MAAPDHGVSNMVIRNVYSEAVEEMANGKRTEAVYEDKSGMVLGVTLTFWILALTIVSVRMYSRIWITKFRGQDDWWILVASLFATGDQTLKIIWCQHGLGRHFANVPMEDFAIFVKVGYAITVQYPLSLGFVKISVLAFYLRVFPNQRFRKLCYGMAIFVICLTLAISLSQLLSCIPLSSSWDLSFRGRCVDKAALQYAGSVLNLVTDIFILLMPMKFLFALTLDKRKRYGVITLFALGFVTCVASTLRLFTVHQFYANEDPTWDATNIAIWSCIEINLTIITASIPAVKPVFLQFILHPLRRVLGTSKHEQLAESKKELGSSVHSQFGKSRSSRSRDGDVDPETPATKGVADQNDGEELDFFAMIRGENGPSIPADDGEEQNHESKRHVKNFSRKITGDQRRNIMV